MMSFLTKLFNFVFGLPEDEPDIRPPEPERIFPQGGWDDEPVEEEREATFVLPAETLSIDDYYASYQLQLQEGNYIDPNLDNFIIGDSLFDNSWNRRRPEKVLPEIYEELLNTLRSSGQKSINEKIMKQPKFSEKLLSKCRKWTFPEEAGEKFEIYNYLHLVQDFLDADLPLAENATISFEDDESKEFRKLLNNNKLTLCDIPQNRNGKKKKNILLVKVPFQKDGNIEEKIVPMLQILLFRDSDVLEVVENPKMYKIRIAFVIPSSQNYGLTTLVAVLDARDEKQFEDLNGNETFSIFVTPNIDATNSIMLGIKKVITNSDLTAKVFPKKTREDVNNYRRQMSSEIDSLFQNSQKPFNQKQKEAIYAMTRSVNTTFVLYGPPGSGKSYTIVEAIRQLLQPRPTSFFNYFFAPPPPLKILICTPSNMASDAIAEAIVERNFINLNEVFRLMSSSRDAFSRNHKLDSITRTTVLFDTNNDAIRPVYDIPSGDAIKKFNIIICTLGSTPKLSRYLPPGHFSHIFVDEAAQASEMEIWLVLGHLATAKTRLILAGDPNQLGPVTNVPVLNHEHFGFKTSLLLRLTKQAHFINDPRNLIQLTDNHRSHHQIVKLSSMLFYKNSLVPTNPPGHNSLCNLPFIRFGDFPIIFHSVKSGIEEASNTKSRRNLAEVDVVIKYVNLCLQEGIKETDIGVIAPYKFQAEQFCSRLKNNPGITVATVERFQGSERRVIIISTVRTSGDLGFVADNLRINTAITRAKHLLIIVGNETCLKTNSTWKKIINFCVDSRSFVNTFPNQRALEQHLE